MKNICAVCGLRRPLQFTPARLRCTCAVFRPGFAIAGAAHQGTQHEKFWLEELEKNPQPGKFASETYDKQLKLF